MARNGAGALLHEPLDREQEGGRGPRSSIIRIKRIIN